MAEQESTVSAAAQEWQAAIAATEGARLDPQLMAQLMQSAALLHRVAKAHPSQDARIVERWLSQLGFAVAMSLAAFQVHA